MHSGETKTEFIVYENNELLLKRKTQLEMNKCMKMDKKYKKNKTIENKRTQRRIQIQKKRNKEGNNFYNAFTNIQPHHFRNFGGAWWRSG